MQEFAREFNFVVLHKGLAHFPSLGFLECVGHGSADKHGIDFAEQIANDTNLVRYLGPAQDRNERTPRILQRLPKIVELLLHQKSRR